jgi:CRP/FNR family transcriptional regulator, cyclic AMP receptor protein
MQDARHRASLPLVECRGWDIPAALLACGRRLEVERGTVLAHEGRPSHAWLVVEAGALRLSCTNGRGCTATLAVLGSGDLLAPSSRGELLAEARAMIDSVVFRVPAPDMDGAIGRDPAIGSWISRTHHRQVDLLRRRLASALSLGVADRLREVLRDLASTHGAHTRDGVRIELPLSQELLATMVGATRESVNRAVRALEARGAIRRTTRGYVVFDPRGSAGANR